VSLRVPVCILEIEHSDSDLSDGLKTLGAANEIKNV